MTAILGYSSLLAAFGLALWSTAAPVPVGRPVRVNLTSQDVIHSFFVPQFRFKQDAVPGREIAAWFEVTKPGRYEAPCAELCGFGHSGMRGWVYAHTPEDYAKWVAENLRPDPVRTSSRRSRR